MRFIRQHLYWILTILLLAGGIFFLFRSNKHLQKQVRELSHQNQHQLVALDSLRTTGYLPLINNIFQKIDRELESNQDRQLSKQIVEEVASICYLLKAYNFSKNDTIITGTSPERGMILLMLVSRQLDTATYKSIFKITDFQNAYLRGARLEGAYLKGINLAKADLKNAILDNAQLSNANLKQANLWGSFLKNAILNYAQLEGSDLQWSNADGAEMQQVVLKGADLSNAQCRNVNFAGSNLQVVDANGIIAPDAVFENADLFRISFKNARLSKVSFKNATLVYADLSDAQLTHSDFTGADLNSAIVMRKDWIMNMAVDSIGGRDSIVQVYEVVEKLKDNPPHYRIQKKSQ